MSATTSELPPGQQVPGRACRAAGRARTGPAARLAEALTALTDEWLVELFEASGAAQAGATLVAVGGCGRREMSAGSDLDLVLLHPGGLDRRGRRPALVPDLGLRPPAGPLGAHRLGGPSGGRRRHQGRPGPAGRPHAWPVTRRRPAR